MTVTKKEIERIADLASLTYDESKMQQLVTDIENIVEFVGQLSTLDADPSLPMYRPGPVEAPLREDVVAPIPLEKPVQDFAPHFRDGFFVVPRLDGV